MNKLHYTPGPTKVHRQGVIRQLCRPFSFTPEPPPGTPKTTLRLAGTVPSEVWNRLGTRILPKLRSGDDLCVGIEFSVSVSSQFARNMETELKQILDDLGLGDRVRVERS